MEAALSSSSHIKTRYLTNPYFYFFAQVVIVFLLYSVLGALDLMYENDSSGLESNREYSYLMFMDRRNALKMAAIASAASFVQPNVWAHQQKRETFKLDYASHFGMFRNSAPGGLLDELQFMYDQGFRYSGLPL